MPRPRPERITDDGGVVKVLAASGDPCKLPPRWTPGTKAVLHFTAHTIPYQQRQDPANWFKGGLALTTLCGNQDTAGQPGDHESQCEEGGSRSDSGNHCTHSAHNENQDESVGCVASRTSASTITETSDYQHSKGCCPATESQTIDHQHSKRCCPASATETAHFFDPNKRNKVGDSREWDGEPLELRIGKGFAVQVLELAVKTMRIGEKARFFCTPPYAEPYIQLEAAMRKARLQKEQERSGKPRIERHSHCAHGWTEEELNADRDLYTLFGCPMEFEIHLLDVLQPDDFQKELWEMSTIERYRHAERIKSEAAELFRKGRFQEAATMFDQAAVLFEALLCSTVVLEQSAERDGVVKNANDVESCGGLAENDTARSSEPACPGPDILPSIGFLRQQRTLCQLNAAACYLKREQWIDVIDRCNSVLKHDPRNFKALLRRSRARIRQGRDLDLAKQDLEQLQCSTSAHPEVTQELLELRSKQLAAMKEERKMFGNLFVK